MSATLPSLTARLQQLAEGQFEAAFLRGKRQALPKSNLDAQDMRFIRERLQRNATYLKTSLEPDIHDKLQRQKLTKADDTQEVIVRAFTARIEQLFGGAIWHMQEAGFAAGVRALGKAIRTRPRSITQETLLERIARLKKAKGDSDLLATPETLARDAPTVTEWQKQMEEEIARKQGLANAAAADAEAGDVKEAELAFGLNVPLSDLADTITQPGFRTGTKYNCENDASSCEPCIANAQGGEDGDGIYWDPDPPPFPGEDCSGFNNCRCTLETVYGS